MQFRSLALISAFAATVPLANWLIGNVGTECIPNGPCLIPVGFGLSAPSGVLVVGAALVLRDAVHEASGVRGALAAIALGGLASWLFRAAGLGAGVCDGIRPSGTCRSARLHASQGASPIACCPAQRPGWIGHR